MKHLADKYLQLIKEGDHDHEDLKDLDCIICHEIAHNPHGCDLCGELVCGKCFPKLKEAKCDVCNVAKFVANHSACALLMTRFECKKCFESVLVGEYKEHECIEL